jgi:polyketide synthase PksN
LLNGRQHLQHRCAVVAQDGEEALYLFRQARSKERLANLMQGKVARDFQAQKVLQQYGEELIQQSQAQQAEPQRYGEAMQALAELYCQGYALEWSGLFGAMSPRRMSLPAYPFAKNTYWMHGASGSDQYAHTHAKAAALHPLLHANTSDINGLRYASTFRGEEFFLSDHIVQGKRVLPGVAYLEMARAAIAQALGEGQTSAALHFMNVVWARPLVVEQDPVQVHMNLYPEADGQIAFEVCSQTGQEEPVVHSQGRVAVKESSAELIDIDQLLKRCEGQAGKEECYEAFAKVGLEYGVGFQALQKVYFTQGQALAELALPSSLVVSQNQYGLHPSLMDGALQASIGLALAEQAGTGGAALPFAIEKMEVLQPCTQRMWALVRYSAHHAAEGRVQKLDVLLCDEQGSVCVRINGFTSRVVEGKVGMSTGAHAAKDASIGTIGTLLLQPLWQEQAPDAPGAGTNYGQQVVILCGVDGITASEMRDRMPAARCEEVIGQGKLDQQFQTCVQQVFETVRAILQSKPAEAVLLQIVVPTLGSLQVLSGVVGLLKCARRENPKLLGQVIAVDAGERVDDLIAKLKENGRSPADQYIRYADGARYVERLEHVDAGRDASLPWKDGGVYLITGGAGELGAIFAQEIASRVKEASLILIGRSSLSPKMQTKLSQLGSMGANACYRQLDIADAAAVTALIDEIDKEYGGLDGIIHSAGIIRDNFIIKKSAEELAEVLAPKVAGLVNLDEATKHQQLDFLICFSSAASVLGNAGQSDYAAANAFMDAYAAYRNSLVTLEQRHGRTLSINWPLWAEGGMRVDAATEEKMMRGTGVMVLRTASGIQALYAAWSSGQDQIAVIEGDVQRIQKSLSGRQAVPQVERPVVQTQESGTEPASSQMQGQMQEKAEAYFKKLLSAVLKLPANQIESDAPMEKYGIDSLLVMKLTEELEKTFGSLSKTLFFEYQTLTQLTEYFLKTYPDKLHALLGTQQRPAVTQPVRTQAAEAVAKHAAASLFLKRRTEFMPQGGASPRAQSKSEDVAIIGLAGRYPRAKNVQEFWENLKNGLDCITEIPSDRWDHGEYFDEDKNKPGKTYTKWGGFIDDVDRFDPMFFNISPRSAEYIDPQERLFLQCAYETLEDAGYTREALSRLRNLGLEGNVGVFVGVMYEEYQLYGAQEQILGRPVALSGSPSSIANRVSYFCNFHGPSIALDTMCSSSLTAIYLACQSLRSGACEVAIAGGVNVSVHPNKYLMLGQGKFASSKGQCQSFGEGGDGYVPAEGVGAVLLKPLSKAIADGDHIYGVVKGAAVNHGGKTNGYSVPNPNAQSNVIEVALKDAGVDPRTISYIEAHGTGTSLGDPIEIAGLDKAFKQWTQDKQFCAIGSAKSNIGHGESAAGIAGLTKILLQMKHQKLVPSLHSKVLNPHIDFANSPFVVQQELADWKRPVVTSNGQTKEYPRIAGISAFGAGGSNAHVVIEEYIQEPQDRQRIEITENNPAVVVLSAKNDERLKEQLERLLAWLEKNAPSNADLADIAYTLQVGREAMDERIAFIAGSVDELTDKLKRCIAGEVEVEAVYRGQLKRNKETLGLFNADEDLAAAVEAWAAKGKYEKLLDLWVKGFDFDWNKMYGEQRPRRISLPTYPFARERYWVPVGPTVTRTEVASSSKAKTQAADRIKYFLKKSWELCPETAAVEKPRHLAILADRATQDLASRLLAEFPGSRILVHNDASAANQDVSWIADGFDAWVDLIGYGDADKEVGNREHAQADWIAGLQKWVEARRMSGGMALCVTKGLEVCGDADSEINLSGATRVGLYRMLQSEYGRLKSRHLDVDTTDAEALIRQIQFELSAEDASVEVCRRGGKRYRSLLQEISHVDAATLDKVSQNGFPEDHVLWITGGTRGIGYACARHFVRHYGVRRLVLTGRDVLPPREQWAAYQDQNSQIARKIRGILELEEMGTQVRVLSVQLTDEAAVRDSVREVKESMGPIGGVIHAAGLVDIENPAFIRKPISGISKVLAPKVTGLEVLADCLAKEPLQFFVLFSSVSATVPSLGTGQSDYAMANAYMDYFAQAHSPALPMISIQWPSWKETGMGEAKSKAYHQTGMLPHTDEEGLELLDKILRTKLGPVVMPVVANSAVFSPAELMLAPVQEEASAASRLKSNAVAKPAPASANDSQGLEKAVQTWLVSLFADALKIETSKFEIDSPFMDYGADSVLLTQILRQVGQSIANDIDPSILFEYPSIEEFAKWLIKTYPEALSQMLNLTSSVATEEAEPMQHESESDAILNAADVPAAEKSAVPLSIPAAAEPKHAVAHHADIAVVGLSCRFPEAGNLDAYWKLLHEGRSALKPVPQDRWGYSTPHYAGLLDNIHRFDPEFFLISKEDAKAMDPQALLVLEETLNLWSHAGYSLQEIKGKSIGVYIGGRSQHRPDEQALKAAKNPILAMGQNYLAANVSQFFDLRGPSLVLDTACSSALVGMNLAVQALHSGEISAAVVGGVGLLHTDAALRVFERRDILTKEFHIFDRRANGAVLGEGVGMVLLKTVDQALKDGDRIYATIKGLAINNDGRTAGPVAPSFHAQKQVMEAALAKSGKRPEDIGFVEVNGSGSDVTDLLELKAIEAVYRSSNTAPCGLGSMKPNIGHPLCAEGIASFIKVVLMLHHRRYVPFLSGQQATPHYDIESSAFYFPRAATQWQSASCVAAINCFADGGTNAHVILENWTHPHSMAITRQALMPPKLNRIDLRTDKPAVSNKPADLIQAVRDVQDQSEPDRGGKTEMAEVANDFWGLA